MSSITSEKIAEAMMEPLLQKLWTAEDSLAARDEGWQLTSIRNTLGGELWVITPVGNSHDVMFYVVSRANEGSDLHLRALAAVGAKAFRDQQIRSNQ